MTITTKLKVGLLKKDGRMLTFSMDITGDMINMLEKTKSSHISFTTNDGLEFSGEYFVKKITAGTIYGELTDESKEKLKSLLSETIDKENFILKLAVDNTKVKDENSNK